MTKQSLRMGVRAIGGGLVAAAIFFLGLSGYCGYLVHSFYAGARPLDGTIAEVYRHPVDEERASPGHRMVVSFTDPVGAERAVAMSGLYRAGAGDVGRGVTLYYNPDHPIRVALDSPWNWAGAAVYGVVAFGLLLAGVSVSFIARRWTPPTLARGASA